MAISESQLENDITIKSPPSTRRDPENPLMYLTKRKRDGKDRSVTRKPKRKKSQKKANANNFEESGDWDAENSLNKAIGKMDSSLLADYVAQRTKHFAGDLSGVELEDRRIPGISNIEILNEAPSAKLTSLEELPGFLVDCSTKFGEKVNRLASASKTPGSPHTLVVTAAGIRAAELTRTLRMFQTKDAVIAKLFAKHIKLRDAIEMVKRTRIGVGVGTPSRIIDLLDSESLSLSVLKRLVVDCSHIDQKRRGILDMRDTQEPLIHLLNRPDLKCRYGDREEDVQLIFY